MKRRARVGAFSRSTKFSFSASAPAAAQPSLRRDMRKTSRTRLATQFAVRWSILFLLLVGVLGMGFWVFSRQSWVEKATKNIVIVPSKLDGFTGKIIFAQINQRTDNISLVYFPADFAVDVLGGYGKYQLRSVLPLLQLEKKSAEFTTAAYSFGLGSVVDEVWVSDVAGVFDERRSPTQLFQDVLLNRVSSRLTPRDRFGLYRFFTQLRPDQVEVKQPQSLSEWQKIQAKLLYPERARDCSISIINTTKSPGMGSTVSQVLEKSGYTVLRVTDDVQKKAHTEISVMPDSLVSCAEVLDHMTKILPFSVKITSSSQAIPEFRSHIVVLLGEDFAQEYERAKR